MGKKYTIPNPIPNTTEYINRKSEKLRANYAM